MARGIEKGLIYLDDQDRKKMLERIAAAAPTTDTSVYAWSLMPNHYHLLVRSGEAGLSKFMRRVQTGYAGDFNRRHRRTGYVFQNRFKSILVEEEPYFLELVRYLHLNPLRAGLVKNLKGLEAFPWSGHASLVGKRKTTWQDTEYVLSLFASDLNRAMAAYKGFVSDGRKQGRRPELVGGGLVASVGGVEQMVSFRRGRERWSSDERVLGSGEFVLESLKQSDQNRLHRIRPEQQADWVVGLVSELSRIAKINKLEVLGKSRRRPVTNVRAAVCWLSVTSLGLPAATVARLLGIRRQAVLQAQERGQKWVTLQKINIKTLLNKLT